LQPARPLRLLLVAGVIYTHTQPHVRHGERRRVRPAAGTARPDEDPMAESWAYQSGMPMPHQDRLEG
jgi:hypothetical protein